MTTTSRRTLRSTRARASRAAASGAAVILAAGLALTGCSGGNGDSASLGDAGGSSGSGAGGGDVSAPDAQEGGAGSVDDGDATRTSARVLPDDGRDIVYTGSVTVRVRDVATAARRVETMTLAMGGLVYAEETSQVPGKRRLGTADLTLRVPPEQFQSTLDRVGRLGAELSRTRSARNVTTELADVDSRVRSQERSVARVRSLLAEAESIGEVVQIESELARREADLESLQAQLARLTDVTDLATVEVTLLAEEAPAPPAVDEDEFGFLVGLRGGLTALVGIVVVGLTVVGALLPFVLVAGLLGWPAYLLVRRSRRPAQPPAPATPSS